MMKRLISLLLVFLLLCPGAMAESALADRYEAAAFLMVSGDYEGAAEAFSALTGYSDAPQMAIYCRGLAFAAQGEYDTAVLAFSALGNFKDSAILSAYYTGVGAQAKADKAHAGGKLMDLEAALTHLDTAETAYAGLIYLPDVPSRLESCRLLRQEISAVLPGLRLAHACDRVATGDDEHFIVWQDGKAGVLHISGRLVVPCEWDNILSVGYGLAVVYQGALDRYGEPDEAGWGVIDLNGNEILPCEWQSIGLHDDGFWAWDEYWQITRYSSSGEPLELESFTIAEDRFFKLRENSWVLTDAQDNVLYQNAAASLSNWFLTGDTMWILTGDDATNRTYIGLITLDGEVLLPPEYTLYSNDYLYMPTTATSCLLLTAPDGTTAAYGPDGTKLFDLRWNYAFHAGENLFGVLQGDLLGYVDMEGTEVIPCVYDRPYQPYEGAFVGGLAVVCDPDSGYYGCIDSAGRVILPFEWDYISLTEGFILAEQEYRDAAVILNHEGKVLLEVPDDTSDVSFGAAKGCFAVTIDGQLTIIDTQGNVVY